VNPLERALAIRTKDALPPELAETRFALARAVWDARGDRARAVALANDARAGYAPDAARFGGEYAEAVAAIDAWLAARR
jgi:hypothetical protein